MAVNLLGTSSTCTPTSGSTSSSRRVRAGSGGAVVVDTTRPVLVWEPRRVVPWYAVPVEDLAGELVVSDGPVTTEHPVDLGEEVRGVLDPRTPFAVHTCPGTAYTLRTATGDLPGAAFAPEDPDLAGYVVLDWNAFDEWREEDQVVLAHPHDPAHRIDCLRSTRHVVVAAGDVVLADTRPPDDALRGPDPGPLLRPPRRRPPRPARAVVRADRCAYKGEASYWSLAGAGETYANLAWTYEEPLNDAVPVGGMVAFYQERLDLTVDGEPLPRPRTPWS